MNEFTQDIKFLKSRLNWDADISLLGDGESKYVLNAVPWDEQHAGVRSNCLGTTWRSTMLGAVTSFLMSSITYTTSTTALLYIYRSSALLANTYVVFDFTLRGESKRFYVVNDGYTTTQFMVAIIDQIQKLYGTYITGTPTYNTNEIRINLNIKREDGFAVGSGQGVTSTQPVGMTILGAFYDDKESKTYFWTTGSPWHCLYEYDHIYDVIYELYLGDNISPQGLYVTDAMIVGQGRDRLLYWLYNNGTAHKVNLYNCIFKLKSFSLESTCLAKRGPFKDITFTQTNSATYKNYDQYFQLLVRNKFLDNEKSVFSTLSPLIYPSDYSENSVGLHGGTSNKRYDLAISDDIHNEWDQYEYAVKTNDGEWQLVTLKDSTVAGYNKEITGSDVISSVAPSDINRPFDYVPQRINSIQPLGNNRIAVAGCTEGYANVSLNVELANVSESIPSAYTVATQYLQDTGGPASFTILLPSATQFGSHALYIKSPTKEYWIYLPDDTGLTRTQVATWLKTYIETNIVDSAITSVTVGSNAITITGTSLISSTYMYFAGTKKLRSFANGTTHYLAIVYYDKYGRCGGANISDDMALFVPSGRPMSHIQLTIKNSAPSWASYYKIFYGGSDKTWYQQYVVRKEDVVAEASETKIYVNNCILSAQGINSAFNVGSYVFNKGDRIRVLEYTNIEGTNGSMKFTDCLAFPTILDTEILSQEDDYITIPNIHNGNMLALMALNSSSHYLIEIYTPRIGKPIEYYETPYMGTITTGAEFINFHNYPTLAMSAYTRTNQTASSDMVCTLEGFDHTILQTFYLASGLPVTFWITSESFSNYFNSKTKGLGRVNFYNEDFNQLERNIVRCSNVYIPNTKVNGLSTFEYDNEAVLEEAYGMVTGIKLVGDVLKIVQPHKIASMYIGAEIGTDGSGNQILLSSNKVLTQPRYSPKHFGSKHIESLIVHDQYLYGYDVINGTAWRDTPGGTFDIANGMSSYFKYKTRQLTASCGDVFHAVGAYDYQNQMYLLTFKDAYNSANDETIGFHEPTESWYSFFGFKPDRYCSIPGKYLVSFSGGKLYTHDSTTKNNFYGTQGYTEIWAVSNIYPDEVKKWNSLVQNANTLWAMSQTDSIIIDEDSVVYQDPQNYTKHKGKMQSMIPTNCFRNTNGEFKAEFLRDFLTSNPTTITPLDLHNGRNLQGKTILLKLRNSSTSDVYLKGLKINGQIAR